MGEEAATNRAEQRKLASWKSTSDSRIKRRYNGQLYARFTKYGFRIEQRLHETNLQSAKKSCDLIEDLIAHNRSLSPNDIREKVRVLFGAEPERNQDPVLIGEHWPKFTAFRKEGSKIHKIKPWREKTATEYQSFWKRSFEPFWTNKVPFEIGEQWQHFIEAERERSAKGALLTFANHHKYFQAFTSYLVLIDVLDKKPLIWNPDPDKSENEAGERDGEGIVIQDSKIREMFALTEKAFGCYIRVKALMGMRSSEITQLKINRIDLKKKVIRLRAIDVKTGSKTGKGRIVPIHPDALDAIKDQLSRAADAPVLFPNKRDSNRSMDPTGFYGQWNELKQSIGLPEITPHDLRHSYATKIFSNPRVNPLLACKALGMSMQTAERVYIHFDEKHLEIVSQNFSVSGEGAR